MGLDITAYSQAVLLPQDHDTTCESYLNEEWCNHVLAFAYAGFEQSFAGLARDPDFEQTRGGRMVGGRWYDVSNSMDHGFRAGSYGGYSRFREYLAEIGSGVTAQAVWESPERHQDDPFYLIVNFADNEGCIGPVAARRLLKDFQDNRARFFDMHEDSYEREKYDDWVRAFELGADDGLVEFH